MHFPKTSDASAHGPEEGHCQPTPPQEALKHSQIGLAQCPVGSMLLSWCAQVLFVPYKSGVSVSLSPLKVLQSNPTGLQSQIPWGFPVPLPDPLSLMWGQESSQKYKNFFGIIFSNFWVTHLEGKGFYFIMIAPFLPSHCGFSFVPGLGYLFSVGSSVLLSMAVQQLVEIWVLLQKKMNVHPSALPS